MTVFKRFPFQNYLEIAKADDEKPARNSWKQPNTRLKFTYQEQKDYEVIEGEIAGLEERKEMLVEKMERWMYLEELKARIDAQ